MTIHNTRFVLKKLLNIMSNSDLPVYIRVQIRIPKLLSTTRKIKT